MVLTAHGTVATAVDANDLIARDPLTLAVIEQVTKVAVTDAAVLTRYG